MGLFGRFVSTEERKVAELVESKGGPTKVRQDDDILKSLLAIDTPSATRQGAAPAAEPEKPVAGAKRDKAARPKKSLTLDELKSDLREDIDEALERNVETFVGKFELQVSMLRDALEKYIHAENDRVIGAVTDVITQGPHTRIKDAVCSFYDCSPSLF